MHPRKRVDPTFHRLNVGFYVFPARQSNDGLRQCQRILGAMIDLAGQQILTFFRLLALGDVNGDAADPHDTAAVVDRCRGGADAPGISPSGRLIRNSASYDVTPLANW